MANSLPPDQTRRFDGHDLDPNSLQYFISADDTGRLRVKCTTRLKATVHEDRKNKRVNGP